MCGDSTNAEDVAKLMDGVKADMLFTDPPYGYSYQSNMRVKSEKFEVLKNDDKILDFFGTIAEYITGFIFVCASWKVLPDWWEYFEKYFSISNMIIWNKGGGGIGDLKHTFLTDYEIILCSNNNQEIKGKRIGSVWSVGKDDVNSYVHATQKPIGLSAIAIKECTNNNDIVLDVFGGSGSTLIASEQLKRKCYMMEIDPKYADVIIKRWEEYTGKKAEKL
jgi:DNA modification methylase